MSTVPVSLPLDPARGPGVGKGQFEGFVMVEEGSLCAVLCVISRTHNFGGPYLGSTTGYFLNEVSLRKHSVPEFLVSPITAGIHWQWRPFDTAPLPQSVPEERNTW